MIVTIVSASMPVGIAHLVDESTDVATADDPRFVGKGCQSVLRDQQVQQVRRQPRGASPASLDVVYLKAIQGVPGEETCAVSWGARCLCSSVRSIGRGIGW